MLDNYLAIPISNGPKKKHPNPTYNLPKITNRIRTEHTSGSRSTRDTLKTPETEQRLEYLKPGKRVAEMDQPEHSEIL